MKKIRIKNFKKEYQNYLDEKESNTLFLDIKLNLKIYIYIVINSIILLYLASENILNKKEIKKLAHYSEILKKNINLNKDDILTKKEYTKFIKGNLTDKAIDKDMIGLKYPEIMFDHIKENNIFRERNKCYKNKCFLYGKNITFEKKKN